MKYPFLTNNELVLIDYLPGSSGQLLIRIWSELDSRVNYDNTKILTDITINDHKSSREIDYDILIPKRITNWFLDRCEPTDIIDYVQFFEFLSTTLLAGRQRWNWNDNNLKFYENNKYEMKNHRVLYGIHTWNKNIPFAIIRQLGYNISCISIVPDTVEGLQYQHKRCQICYPITESFWKTMLPAFNKKTHVEKFDFCTLLANKDTKKILEWLTIKLGSSIREDKIPHVVNILECYYSEIVNNLN